MRIIGLEQRSSQYESIRIEVEDTGFGMTSEYLEIIFDAFTRAENSTTNKVHGTGLGMAITKNIVELMGGTIDVTSEVGKGSLFTVELELRIAHQKADKQFWKKYGISRILVVDSDRKACQDIQTLMEETNLIVEVLFNGEEAVRAICETSVTNDNDYHLLLLAWQMAGIDGIETAKRYESVVLSLFLFSC